MLELEKIKKAKKAIVDNSLTIWNARLEALAKSGDMKAAIDHMLTPGEAGFFDNCDCHCTPTEGSEPLGRPTLKKTK
jgi:hypothetical protein